MTDKMMELRRRIQNAANETDTNLMKMKEEEEKWKDPNLHSVLAAFIREIRLRDELAHQERTCLLKNIQFQDMIG